MLIQLKRYRCVNDKKECIKRYDFSRDGIFQWSSEICIADEVFYLFLAARGLHENFLSSFCTERTKRYLNFNISSAKFVGNNTFVSCFFGWIANWHIDFRAAPGIDELCGHNPEVLACDGVHVGVAVRFLAKSTPITKNEINEVKPIHQRRYDRVFLPGTTPQARKTRNYVIDFCKYTILNYKKEPMKSTCDENPENSFTDDDSEENMPLSNRDTQFEINFISGIQDDRLKIIISKLFKMEYQEKLLKKLARLILALTSGAPLIGFFPWNDINKLKNIFSSLKVDKENKRTHMEKLEDIRVQYSDLMECAYQAYDVDDIADFFVYLLDETEKMHLIHSTETTNEDNVPEHVAPFDPSSGTCYYFTPHGAQVRKTPMYEMDGKLGLN